MAETPQKLSVIRSASCATFSYHNLAESKNIWEKCGRSSLPDQLDSRRRYPIFPLQKLWNRFVCLLEELKKAYFV